MKKMILAVWILLVSLSSVFAYELNNKDKEMLTSLQSVLEVVYENDYKKFEDIQDKVNSIFPSLKTDTRSYELMSELQSIMNNISWRNDVSEVEVQIIEYTLVKIVDGDTITLNNSITWEDTTYRLIWIDAPETSALRFWEAEEYWKESMDYLKELLESGHIQVEYDESQWRTDKYDRDLAYIFVAWVNVNQEMIVKWYAKEYTYDKPYKYQSEFTQAEKQAQGKESWIWWLEEKEETDVYSWFTDTQSNWVCNIKWNISSKGEKIYHYEWCQSYTRTKISLEKWEQYFCSTKEAEDAWWRIAGNCN